ncbi:hypothetical protein C8035_v003295 [Colletotrichum spinosum]|uniref:Secreted protein n=1 Tax=Colletotrichum spinosum TaxID=1347390 RepID=A0A4V3HTE4_9PEZI|nr:hypothetical protein C8035_v003295 [Colletotrichum spinosum]
MLLFKVIAFVAFLHSLSIRAVYAIPVAPDATTDTTTDLEPAWPEEKRQVQNSYYATLGLICYKDEGYHPAIVAVYPDGSSVRWHSPDCSYPGHAREWEVKVERKRGPPWEERNYLETQSRKSVRMVGTVKTFRLDSTLNDRRLLPRGKENCWWYLHRGMKALVRNGVVDEDIAHKAYTGLKRRTAWSGRPWPAPRWRDQT